MSLEEILGLIDSTISEWESTKADHNLTDELIAEGREILKNR